MGLFGNGISKKDALNDLFRNSTNPQGVVDTLNRFVNSKKADLGKRRAELDALESRAGGMTLFTEAFAYVRYHQNLYPAGQAPRAPAFPGSSQAALVAPFAAATLSHSPASSPMKGPGPAPAHENPFWDPTEAPPSYDGHPVPALAPEKSAAYMTPQATGFAPQVGASASSARPVATPLAAQASGVKEEQFKLLAKYDVVFVVDDSSATGAHWGAVREAIAETASVVGEHDQDGFELRFLYHPQSYTGLRSAEQVNELLSDIQPQAEGTAYLGAALDPVLASHMQALTKASAGHGKGAAQPVKPLIVMVITPGIFDMDVEDVEEKVLHYAKKLDKMDAPLRQVGVQFVHVSSDPNAPKSEHLQHLDEYLEENGAPRDMIDTKRFVPGDRRRLLEILLGAVVQRLDRAGERRMT
ncbi:MAG TPA: hypothetical protein VFH51_19545 [Myxococcota bacterium]|nr:hypothetical protein [Myxococcota bacterium]